MKHKPTFIHYYLSQGVAYLKSSPYLYLDLTRKTNGKMKFGKTANSSCAAKTAVVYLCVYENVHVFVCLRMCE